MIRFCGADCNWPRVTGRVDGKPLAVTLRNALEGDGSGSRGTSAACLMAPAR
jgi:hypothetical protein